MVQINKYGFVELLDRMPSGENPEACIADAARTSTRLELSGPRSAKADNGLIRFLWRNNHTSPFEMVQLKFAVKCPIFVARQWMRHRTGSFNEYSGRYSKMKDEFYIPEARMQSSVNKQMSDDREVPEEVSQDFATMMANSANLYEEYESLVNRGIAKEVARMSLGMNIYTQFIWSVNLRNLMHFLGLRMAPDAQPEIREYADAIYDIISPLFPVTCQSYQEDNEKITFTAAEIKLLKRDYTITFSHTSESTGTMADDVHKKLLKLLN